MRGRCLRMAFLLPGAGGLKGSAPGRMGPLRRSLGELRRSAMRHRSRLQRLEHALVSADQAGQLRRITIHHANVLPGGEEYIVPPLPPLDPEDPPDDISFIIANAGAADTREAAEHDFRHTAASSSSAI